MRAAQRTARRHGGKHSVRRGNQIVYARADVVLGMLWEQLFWGAFLSLYRDIAFKGDKRKLRQLLGKVFGVAAVGDHLDKLRAWDEYVRGGREPNEPNIQAWFDELFRRVDESEHA